MELYVIWGIFYVYKHYYVEKWYYFINCGCCIQCRESRVDYLAQHLKMEGQDYGKNKLLFFCSHL